MHANDIGKKPTKPISNSEEIDKGHLLLEPTTIVVKTKNTPSLQSRGLLYRGRYIRGSDHEQYTIASE